MADSGEVGASGVRSNHLCWVYDDPLALRERAVAFLTEGLAAGERLHYVGEATVDALRPQLQAVPGLDTLLEDARLTIASLQDTYGRGEVVDPANSVSAYAEATRDALAAGFTGLRVVAEATPLVRTPAQRRAFVRYEHLVDRYMAGHPFAALCAYDAGQLGAATAELACLHPAVNTGATMFQWYAGTDTDLQLAGEIDAACHELFDETVGQTIPMHAPGSLTLDARQLDFIDHRGLLALDEQAYRAGKRLSVLSDAPILHRLVDVLDLRAVRLA